MAAGLPLDADAIAAGILLEAADVGYLDYDTIHKNLGGDVAMLVRDVSAVWALNVHMFACVCVCVCVRARVRI